MTTRDSSSCCSKPATPSPTTTRTPCSSEEVPDELAVLGVERRQHLVGHLDDGHLEAAVDEVLGHLEADEAAADDDGPLLGSHGLEARVVLHAGEEARPPLDPLADLPRVGHRADLRRCRAGRCRATADGSTRHPARAPAGRRTRWSPRRWRRRAARRSWSAASMPTTSQPVRQSTANCSRKTRSLATSRLDSCSMTPPTWYGRPQLAYETYGPRSTMRISACSSNRRRRAAHDAPPATPPTMITFMSTPPSSSRSFAGLARMVSRSDPRSAPAADVGDERVGRLGTPRAGCVAAVPVAARPAAAA